jgi:DNA-directed RNA polymerase I, II, and III subunit RPABC1
MDDRVFNTLREMLTDRGIKSETFDPVTPAMDETRMFAFGGVLIIYSTKTRVLTNEFNNFIAFAKENGYNSGVIIISESPTSEKVLGALINHISDRDNQLVQMFLMNTLFFNITKHQLQPKMRIIADVERTELAKKFPELDKLPRIESQDAMAKYLGARPGDIVEVTGMCESTAENKRWRICVAETTNG